jgi:ABC-type multidrug transport system ATPase subunit
MSEKILKALMQLFAIIAKVDGVTVNGRNVVQVFLKQQLNQDLVDEYLKLFDLHLEEQPERKRTVDPTKKRASVKDSVRVLLICTQINEELTQKQKIIVVVRLLEFIKANGILSPQELEFINTVASTFNVEDQEYNALMDFALHSNSEHKDSDEILIIDNNKEGRPGVKTKHIYSESLDGQLKIVRVLSVDIYIIRYFGTSEINLNGQALRKEQVYILTHGSSLRSSKISPIYYSDIVSCFLSDTSQTKITFIADNLQYKFKNGKIGLHPLSFSEDSGKLIGIMGASGAGKSTLLNILNSIEKPTSGSIKINGINIHTEKDKIEGVIGYVSQDDLLIEELSVFENLFYNAKLCFSNFNDEKIKKIVLNLLSSLGLLEIKNLKVGSPLNKKISGGQRKRLNIGLELIREPSVLFVDEPTSGLSSRDSENIMDLLKELSLKGKLVFVVIHQPSSDIYKMFDKLLILDTGGYPIYNGNPVDAIIYFKKIVNHVNSDESECLTCGNVNPEQIFNIIESKVIDEYGNPTRDRKVLPKQWNDYYIENKNLQLPESDKAHELPKIAFNIPTRFNQFKVFITRDVLSKLSNVQYMLINSLEAPFLAFILAYLVKYFNAENVVSSSGYNFRDNENLPAYLFMTIVVALFMGLTVSAEEIIRDRKILKREAFLNLSRSSYLYSKVSILFFISAIQTLTFVLLGNWIMGIHGMTLSYWMVLFSVSCFANMLGLNISASFNSAVTIYILIPILLIPQLLLSGVIVKFDKLNPAISTEKYVPIAGEMMTSRWAFEALAVRQFKDNEFEKEFYAFEKDMSIAEYKKQYWIPEIRSRADFCDDNYKDPQQKEMLNKAFKVLDYELRKEKACSRKVKLRKAVDSLDIAHYKPTIGIKIKSYLLKLNDYYIKMYNTANRKKDELITQMQATPELKQAFITKQNNYLNESLSDLVKNNKEANRIVERDGVFIQKLDPIYLDPQFATGPLDIRAHFFAPQKQFFDNFYDTFWVNIIFIWLMCLLLYLTLYFESLKKLLSFFENVFDRIIKPS